MGVWVCTWDFHEAHWKSHCGTSSKVLNANKMTKMTNYKRESAVNYDGTLLKLFLFTFVRDICLTLAG